MKIKTRNLLNSSFTGMSMCSVALMAVVLIVILLPVVIKGSQAYLFRATSEFRRFQFDKYERGNVNEIKSEQDFIESQRLKIYTMIADFEANRRQWPRENRKLYSDQLKVVKEVVHELFGPAPNAPTPVLLRKQYGQIRWDRAKVKLNHLLYEERWVNNPSDPNGRLISEKVPRVNYFAGSDLEPLFATIEHDLDKMLKPKLTFYWQFLIDDSHDAHFFGGIGAEFFGTIYLTIGALFFAIPFGVISAIYLCEYAKPTKTISLIRSCVNTLAGVPSVVFGLFGLAFFLDTLKVSESKSVLAGSLTLALMILPTIIRASEEAIMAVPMSFKEAALGLGAGKWFAIRKVVLPAALPGILTGVIISMGRAAGETAPIIFTAAVSMGEKLPFLSAIMQPTPALPWNIYNLCSEHEAVDEIRHVQFGMVFTLIAVVLIINLAALVIRARVAKKMK
ncbi:MAG: phosphate ABC transporter permease PstA [Lentisphaeria bacterium]